MMEAYAQWRPDCQGKQDFDGPILSVSTRFYPGPDGGGGLLVTATEKEFVKFSTVPYGPRPSAIAAIHLNLGPRAAHDGGGEYRVWRRKEFEGETEESVKSDVEKWCADQMEEIVSLLGGAAAFKDDA